MLRFAVRCIFAAALLLPAAAIADPVKLKLSFFTSDRSNVYQCHIKPFVDAVNADGEGLIHIDVYFSGAISKSMPEQPKLVADDTADIAIVVPGYTPQQFPDSAVMELPGLFRDKREFEPCLHKTNRGRRPQGVQEILCTRRLRFRR